MVRSVARHKVVSETQGRQQIIGRAARKSLEEIRRGWRDDDGVGPACQLDVAHRGFGLRIEELGAHRLARQCLEGERRHELTCRRGHHHLHFGAGFDQASGQVGRFVRGDAAGDAEQQASAGQRCRFRGGLVGAHRRES
jgi:hypothetical protein